VVNTRADGCTCVCMQGEDDVHPLPPKNTIENKKRKRKRKMEFSLTADVEDGVGARQRRERPRVVHHHRAAA
jgi:hypothetical protein